MQKIILVVPSEGEVGIIRDDTKVDASVFPCIAKSSADIDSPR